MQIKITNKKYSKLFYLLLGGLKNLSLQNEFFSKNKTFRVISLKLCNLFSYSIGFSLRPYNFLTILIHRF